MKYLPLIASILLGLLFIMSSVVVLFGLAPTPDIPKDTLPWHYMQAFAPTGYMTFVKVLELIGGVLVIIPKTRNVALLILGPILVNILAFHQFVAKDGIFQPMLLILSALALYLLWSGRKAWSALVG